MIIHVTAFAILTNSFTYDLGLEGSTNRTGYLHALSGLSSPVLVPLDSTILYTKKLPEICTTLGFPGSFPLHKLEQRKHSASESIYHVDNCITCYDLYVECNPFPFRLDPSGNLRVNFESEWSAMCVKGTFSRRTSVTYCKLFLLPSENVTIIQGTREENQKSYEFGTKCKGSQCSFQLLESDCHQGFAAMTCSKIVPQFKLVRGDAIQNGLLQMASPYNGWNYVSLASVSLNDVVVFCNSLGFPSSNSNFYNVACNGYYNGITNLYPLRCLGNETKIGNCPGYRGIGFGYDNYILGISCTVAKEGELRVTGGYDNVSGRLEIYHNNKWGTICSNYGPYEVKAACSTVTGGRLKLGRQIPIRDYNTVMPVWLDGVTCPTQTSFHTCTHKPWGQTSCVSTDAFSIQCEEGLGLQFRLVGSMPLFKTLQVFHNGEWGSLCGTHVGENEAKTACNTLGLPSQHAEIKMGYSGLSERIWSNMITCNSVKQNLLECGVFNWGKIDQNCQSASVLLNCPAPLDASNTEFRLEGSGVNNAGVVEVNYRNEWRTVCFPSHNDRVAKVICRTLGLPVDNAASIDSTIFETSRSFVWLPYLMCRGDEDNVFECQNETVPLKFDSCSSSRRFALACPSIAPVSNYPLRLVGDDTESVRGSVEVQVFGIWGRVCSSGIDIGHIKVMCRQLGTEPTADTKELRSELFGNPPETMTWSVSGQCAGDESDLTDCYMLKVTKGSCSVYSDLAVLCKVDHSSSSLVGPLVGGILGAVFIAMFGPIVWMLISQRRNKKKYPTPSGGRAPLGTPVDRLGGDLLPPTQPQVPESSFNHFTGVGSQRPPIYTVSPPPSYELGPVRPGQILRLDTSSSINETAPSIDSDPPGYFDIFPDKLQNTGESSSQV